MKSFATFVGLMVAIGFAAVAGTAAGAEEHTHGRGAPESGGSVLGMAKFYPGVGDRVGTFPGKLVCLRCDLKGGSEAMAACAKEGHRHALAMDGGSMIHPLLAGTEEVLARINSAELHGKHVEVRGKYYPSTGVILVDRIAEAPEKQ